MITSVNYRVIECDFCKCSEQLSPCATASEGWERIQFSCEGLLYRNIDACPNCVDKVKKFMESIEMERY